MNEYSAASAPTYGLQAAVKFTPQEWVEAGMPGTSSAVDWSAWPAAVAQFDRELEANAGVPIGQIRFSLSTVAWFWQCENGHRWQESAYSRRGRFSSGRPNNRARIYQRVAGSKSACRECTLDEFAARYSKCGHPSRDISLVSRQPTWIVGFCDECLHPAPQIGDAVFADHHLPTSKAELELRRKLSLLLPVTPADEANAVIVPPTPWGSDRVFPDILLASHRIAIEYDSPGFHGDAHAADGNDPDKDAALRSAGWEVIRVRTGDLPLFGPYDVAASGPTQLATNAVQDMVTRVLLERDDA
ncbi:hypothetical protein [Hoyosella subflava]|uniref:DUF559 domain-containing protein n=1 Tax=Hoyosella subflava (strain DSM 45089 / JCM 17490 / NBRC 109087 / DQS3-9A1) TaxID=443218 RepID=F6EL69_HOYSD|nr:hypothetical protein [Hoyosella subflava]AEF42732.1 hypothetical protein AS9A_4299 [Hoyosella subflava DQS3-9A1]